MPALAAGQNAFYVLASPPRSALRCRRPIRAASSSHSARDRSVRGARQLERIDKSARSAVAVRRQLMIWYFCSRLLPASRMSTSHSTQQLCRPHFHAPLHPWLSEPKALAPGSPWGSPFACPQEPQDKVAQVVQNHQTGQHLFSFPPTPPKDSTPDSVQTGPSEYQVRVQPAPPGRPDRSTFSSVSDHLQAAVNAFMHQAQASSTTSITSDNCSALDIKPTIQQNGSSQSSSAPKQREGTTQASSLNSSGNTNANSNNNDNSTSNNNSGNTNSNNNHSNNAGNSLNAGLYDNSQNVYGGSSAGNGGYDGGYHSYHQANNASAASSVAAAAAAAAAFQSINAGGNAGNNGGVGNVGIGMRTNLSPNHHHHHHHSSAGNKPQRTKPRTSAGKRNTNTHTQGQSKWTHFRQTEKS